MCKYRCQTYNVIVDGVGENDVVKRAVVTGEVQPDFPWQIGRVDLNQLILWQNAELSVWVVAESGEQKCKQKLLIIFKTIILRLCMFTRRHKHQKSK